MIIGFLMQFGVANPLQNVQNLRLGTMELWDGDRQYELYFDKAEVTQKDNVVTIRASKPLFGSYPDIAKIDKNISVNSIFTQIHLSLDYKKVAGIERILDIAFIDENEKRLGCSMRAQDSILTLLK